MKTYATTLGLLEAYKKEDCPIYPILGLYRIITEDSEINTISLTSVTELFANETPKLSYWIGGSVNICETEHDLKSVQGCDFEWARTHDNKWPNVTDIPLLWDICEYCEGKPETDWFMFMLCSNNAGGPVYYVPRHLWDKARIEEHLKKNESNWKI